MKGLLLLLLALPCFLFAQDDETTTDGFMGFALNDSTATEIDWQHDTPFEEFELAGKTPLRYALRPVNDTLTQLLAWDNGNWQPQETIAHSDYVYALVMQGFIFSTFSITDFDHDGDQDLTCLAHTDVYMNQWTLVFINDQTQHRLVRLVNTAEDNTDIWDDPHYDPKTGLLHTELYSGVYGEPARATYKLKGTTVEPVFKEAFDSTNPDYIVTTTYKGKNGKWKLKRTVRQKVIKS